MCLSLITLLTLFCYETNSKAIVLNTIIKFPNENKKTQNRTVIGHTAQDVYQ